MSNLKKDLAQGEGSNCRVLGTNADEADFVTRTTPLQTKMREFAASQAELGSELAPDIDKSREKYTTAKRRNKDTRPL